MAFFHGQLEMQRLSLPEILIVKGSKAPLGDFRDWPAVTAWANGMVSGLK
jgi:hypothetical protein